MDKKSGGQPEPLNDAGKQAATKTETVIEFDPRWVVCDFCNTDFTDSKVTGGTLLHGTAICPQCTAEYAETIALDKHEQPHGVQEPEPDETFAAFVRRMRGPDSNRIGITMFKDGAR